MRYLGFLLNSMLLATKADVMNLSAYGNNDWMKSGQRQSVLGRN